MRMRCELLVVVFLASSSVARGDGEELGRFQTEYPPAAKRLEDQLTGIKGTCRVWRTASGQTKPFKVDEAKFALDHGREVVRFQRKHLLGAKDQGIDELVYGAGKDGMFSLFRPPGEKTFTVRGVGETPIEFGTYNTAFGQYPKASFAIFGVPLTAILRSSTCRITNVGRIKRNGRDLVKVDYQTGVENASARTSVVLDPDAGWIIRSVELYLGGPSLGHPLTFEVDYSPPNGSATLPRSVTYHDPSGGKWLCQFDEWRFEPTPEAEFMMPYYGLPDLVSASNAPRSALRYWLAGIAGVLALVAIALRQLALRGVVPVQA